MGILLFAIAFVLNFLVTPFVILYTLIRTHDVEKIDNYFKQIAIEIDFKGNITSQYFFNDVLIKKGGYKFGSIGDTISYVLGMNYELQTLTFLGKIIVLILSKEHVLNAIKNKHLKP